MYVQRLIEFSEKNPEQLPAPGYTEKKIQWVVDIEESGLNILPLDNISMSVPDVGRSSNIRPILLADKPDYIFGFYENERNKERAQERQQAFINLLEEYVEDTSDEDVKLLIHYLKNKEKINADFRIGDFIVFRTSDELYLHEKQEVIDFWGRYISQEDEEDSQFTCMFCHEKRSVLRRHSIDFLIGPDRTKMISANENAYESYGLKNSEIAPTCFDCEQKYGKALEYLLTRYKDRQLRGGPHMFNVGELTYVYWIRDGNQLDSSMSHFISPMEEQTPSDMHDLLNQAFRGVSVDRDVNNFCLLSLSSNKGRLVVRDYVEDSVGKIKDRIKIFFNAQDVGQERLYGIYTLASTMYTEPRNQMQKYAIEEWMNWFLHGSPLSAKILIPILRRIQAIGTMYPQYGAAIKSWLVSRGRGDLDMRMANETDAYITGRVFAILERVQYVSTESDATITGKFFSSASTTPRSVMGMIIRNSQYYLEKLLSSDRRGIAINLEKDLGEVLSKLKTFPSTLDLEEQAEFALGYYHQRQHYFTPKNEKERNK